MIVGIDPGLSGAIAWLDDDGTLLAACDMPVVDGHVNYVDLGRLLAAAPDVAVVEKVHSMPGQGVASTFKFGQAYGAVLGCLGALQVPVEHVTPSKWKRAHRLIGRDKDASRAVAIDRWPDRAELFRRKKDHGRADAALIAAWHLDRRTT